MEEKTSPPGVVARVPGCCQGWGAPITLALLVLATHVAVSAAGGYGYFRDELYYLACADHLDWGYVDHPPLSILLLRGMRSVFGESLVALRLLPALGAAAVVLGTAAIARRLGGGAFAQGMAALAAAAAPMYLGLTGFYSMNALDLLVWTLAALLLTHLAAGGSPRLWIALGVVLGLGLQNKISVLWLGGGIALGLLLTSERRWLRTRWPYAAAAVSAVLASPYLLWQVAHGWPTWEFMQNAQEIKMVAIRPVEFLSEQILVMNPALAPLWVGGLVYLLVAPNARRFRLLGVLYLAVMLLLLANGRSRASYLAAAYPALLAAGSCWIEGLAGAIARVARPVYAAVVLASGVMLAPLALPILPVEQYARYAARLGIEPSTDEHQELATLPQQFADMHGWPEMVATIAGVYHSLPPAEQARAAIFAQNYGEAAAIDFFGRAHGLPHAISGHNSYWLWGPGDWDGSVAVVLGGDEEDNREVCGELIEAARIDCGHCMPYENDQPVWICRGLKLPPGEIWPRLKEFI